MVADTETGTYVRLLAAVLGIWLLFRATNKDSTGRTLIDHLMGRQGSQSPYVATTAVAAGGASLASSVAGAAGAVAQGTGQKAQIDQVARAYGLSPQTLWGVYGTESSFGKNPSTSSAGAQGPFQFIPSTWAQYGRGNVNNFGDALIAAAHYLRSLGANSSPVSSATMAAINAYNGNGGGSSPTTSYAQSVLRLGRGF